MITLHGFPFSNYYNIVKHTLMYKGIDFREDLRYGGDSDWLSISPVGKIPAMTTAQGQHLSESSVCCDYLEETYPETPLYPADSFERSRVRQIMKIAELYLELSSRRLIPFLFLDTDAPEELKREVGETLDRGIGALRSLCKFEPYIAGAELTLADIYVRYVFAIAITACESKLSRDILGEIDGLKTWYEMMADSDISRRIDTDQQANAPEFFAHLQQRFGMEMGKSLGG